MRKIEKLEQPQLTIGFMELTDCAPLIVAKELGLYEKWGLSVTLEKQHSWATLRDKLHTGLLDSAQMLVPMAIASNLGLNCPKTEVVAPFVLSRNGNAITLSENIYQEILRIHKSKASKIQLPIQAEHLKPIIKKYKTYGKKLKFAVVFPYSCHYYQLVSWLNSSGISEKEIEIITISPANMVSALKVGDIDGFCVGGPWNAQAVRDKIGFTGVTSSDIWPGTPEKVLAMLGAWQCKNKRTAQALIMALYESCLWLQNITHRFEAACLLSKPCYLNTKVEIIAPSLLGSCLTFYNTQPREVPSYNQFSLPDERIGNCPDTIDGEMLVRHMLQAEHVSSIAQPALPLNTIFSSSLYHQTLDRHLNSKTLMKENLPKTGNINEALAPQTLLKMK